MKRIVFLRPVAGIALLVFGSVMARISAQAPPTKNYAQSLIERMLARHPEVATLAMHLTPPDSADNVIIASNFGRIGKKADEDDLAVIRTGKPKMEVGSTGDRFSVELPLLDANARAIGALAVAFPYKAGNN